MVVRVVCEEDKQRNREGVFLFNHYYVSPSFPLVSTDRQYLGGVGEDDALVYGGTTPLGSIAM